MSDTTGTGVTLYNKDKTQEGYGDILSETAAYQTTDIGKGELTRRKRDIVDKMAIVGNVLEFGFCKLGPIFHHFIKSNKWFGYDVIENHTGLETD